MILFGSHARGDAGPDSDLDFLVIERDVVDRIAESVRLRRALGSLRLPIDVIVLSVSNGWQLPLIRRALTADPEVESLIAQAALSPGVRRAGLAGGSAPPVSRQIICSSSADQLVFPAKRT